MTEQYPTTYLDKPIKRESCENITSFSKVQLRPCCERDELSPGQIQAETDFEGIYLGTIDYMFPGMPVIWVPKLNRAYAGFECWWSPTLKPQVKK